MTQHQLINQLQDIMPEIVETKNPRAVMLKCAKKNNLSIAQLEKLGHVFNTCKTLIGLEKQATRGASFGIVDVPGMVAEYASYTPGEPSTKRQKDVHSQINAWLNESDNASKSAAMEWAECFTPMGKAASKKLPSVHSMLDDYFKIDGGFSFTNAEEGRQWQEEDLDYVNKPDILHKAASLAQESDTLKASRLYKEACDAYNDLLFETSENARRICSDITQTIRQNNLDWQDVAYDLHDRFQEKAAAAVATLESFFKTANLKVEPVSLEKRGFTRSIAANRYGLYDSVDELLNTIELHDKAAEELVDLKMAKAASSKNKDDDKLSEIGKSTNTAFKSLVNDIPDWNKIPEVAKDMVTVVPGLADAIKEEKIRNKAQEEIKYQGALQQVLLSDPVIQQADQAEVEDLYNTIRNLAPIVARDPVAVAPVLKEALQYGSLPIQQVKDLLAAEKDYQNARKYRAEASLLEDKTL